MLMADPDIPYGVEMTMITVTRNLLDFTRDDSPAPVICMNIAIPGGIWSNVLSPLCGGRP